MPLILAQPRQAEAGNRGCKRLLQSGVPFSRKSRPRCGVADLLQKSTSAGKAMYLIKSSDGDMRCAICNAHFRDARSEWTVPVGAQLCEDNACIFAVSRRTPMLPVFLTAQAMPATTKCKDGVQRCTTCTTRYRNQRKRGKSAAAPVQTGAEELIADSASRAESPAEKGRRRCRATGPKRRSSKCRRSPSMWSSTCKLRQSRRTLLIDPATHPSPLLLRPNSECQLCANSRS